MIEAVYLGALGNVYWTDHGSDLIEVSRLNTVYRAVIISEGLDQPRAIAVQPLEGCVLVVSVITLTTKSLHNTQTVLSFRAVNLQPCLIELDSAAQSCS